MAAIDVQLTARPTVEITHPLVVLGTCDDGNVENSDASYSATVASGGTLVLPNITFTDSDGSTSSVPSVQDITATPCQAIPSLTIGVFSDAGLTTPITATNFENTIYIKATASGITPTLYRFYVSANGVTAIEVFEQAGDTLAYNVFGLEDVVIYAEAIEATTIASTLNATTITVTDANANAFISAHNALTGSTMGSVQQRCTQDMYRMFKGSGTPNGNDLYAYHTANANTRFFPLIPVDDSTVSISAYTLDMFHLATGSYGGFIPGDFSVYGPTGGNTKYFDCGVPPSALPIDNISAATYSRTNIGGTDIDFGASNVANSYTNSLVCLTLGTRYTINDSTQDAPIFNDSLGLKLLNRTPSGIKSFKSPNDLSGRDVVRPTTGSPTVNTYFHIANGWTVSYFYSRRQLCLYWQALGMNNSQIEDWTFIMNHIQQTVITGGRNV